MRIAWIVATWMVVACKTDEPATQAASLPARAASPAPPIQTTTLVDEDVFTTHKPSVTEVAAMLGLDPAHEKIVEQDLGDIFHWVRSYDGIRVDTTAVTSKQGGQWRTQFWPIEVKPEPVRRAELLSPQAAVEKAAREKVRLDLGDKEAMAELMYLPTFADRRKPGTAGTNAMDFVRTIARFDLVYRVYPRGWEDTFVYVDAYDGAILRTSDGLFR